MPLVPCSECGREISDTAKSCPSCGALAPTGKHDRDVRRGQINIISGVAIVVIGGYLIIKYKHLLGF